MSSSSYDDMVETSPSLLLKLCESVVRVLEELGVLRVYESQDNANWIIDNQLNFASEYCHSESGNTLGKDLAQHVISDMNRHALYKLYDIISDNIQHWSNIFNNTAGQIISLSTLNGLYDQKLRIAILIKDAVINVLEHNNSGVKEGVLYSASTSSAILANNLTSFYKDSDFLDDADLDHESSTNTEFWVFFGIAITLGLLGTCIYNRVPLCNKVGSLIAKLSSKDRGEISDKDILLENDDNISRNSEIGGNDHNDAPSSMLCDTLVGSVKSIKRSVSKFFTSSSFRRNGGDGDWQRL